MLSACRRAYLLFSGFLITTAVIAIPAGHPEGFWILENTGTEVPFGGLRLNHANLFKLLIYDDNCQLHTVEGTIKQKTTNSWELKNTFDYSNTFLMTQQDRQLILIDTEDTDQKMFFTETTQSKLDNQIKLHCKQLPEAKVKK